MKIKCTLGAATLLAGLAVAQAQLKISPAPSINVGAFPAESAPVASFELANTGSQPLHIAKVKSDCFCFNPVVYTQTIAPHESTPLDVFIDADLLNGSFEKSIRVSLDGKNATNVVLKVKGTVHHAIQGLPRFIATGRTALHRPWSTNLLLTLRHDLSEVPALRIGGHPQFKGKLSPTPNPQQFNLQLTMPALQKPTYWESRVILSFDQNPAIHPSMIKVNGYAGGTLHPSVQKLKCAGNRATLTLQRIYPAGTPPQPAPLYCNQPGVSIKETPASPGQSTVEFTFSEAFLQQLENEGRIALPLATEGFIPTTLVIEK